MPSPIVTIVGGSGFVGRYIAQAMAKRGWRVRVAVRRPNEAMFVKPYGVVGQVEPIQCNIRDDASMTRVIAGADAVVNCVGVLFEMGANRFDAVQTEGAARVARISAEQGVGQLVHLSAIGADPESRSAYAQSKAEGERSVLEAFPNAVILRPSVIFGTEDQFFNRFAGLSKIAPILPMVGGGTKFQPVWVCDVAEAAARAVVGDVASGTYELGGPRVASFRECLELMLRVIRRRRLLLDIPMPLARLKAWALEKSAWVGIPPMLTVDQVILLESDNVVSGELPGFAEIGIDPASMESTIESYLYAYRPYGQYTSLSENAERADV